MNRASDGSIRVLDLLSVDVDPSVPPDEREQVRQEAIDKVRWVNSIFATIHYVALLLPITFLASRERYVNRRYPVSACYPLARRPSTSEDGKLTGMRDLAWFVWDHAAREQALYPIDWSDA